MPKTTTIADYIREDLLSRIATGSPPARLTLPALATHYRVSLTPVRQAVHSLLTDRVLVKKPNGRLMVSNGSAAHAKTFGEGAVLNRPDEAPDWEIGLAEEIIGLSLRGSVEYLREEAMAQKCDIGRSVLRQCFHRMAGQGLLEHVPRCGWRVRSCNEDDLRAYLVAREAMELAALDLARPHLLENELTRMMQGNQIASENGLSRLNNDLHAYIIAKSGNMYIHDFFQRHGLYYTTLFNFAAPEARVTQEMAEQHREILTALIAKDWLRSRRALSLHIRAQLPIVKRLMEQFAHGSVDTFQGKNSL